MKTQVEDITPELALEYLSRSKGNRKIRKNHVEKYSQLMIAGHFRLTQDGPVFTTDGVLVNCHHRLHAVVKSGVSVKMNVTRNADPEIYKFIDGGLNRQMVDKTYLDKQTIEVIRLCLALSGSLGQGDVLFLEEIAKTPFGLAVEQFHADFPGGVKFFASAPLRLAAIINSMLNSKTWAYGQYAALVTLDYKAMSTLSERLCRKQQRGDVLKKNRAENFCLGMKVFDPILRDTSKLIITDAFKESCQLLCKSILNR